MRWVTLRSTQPTGESDRTANLLSEENQDEFSNSLWHFPGITSYYLPIGHNSVFQDGILNSIIHNSSPEISTTQLSIFQDGISKIGFSKVGIKQTRSVQTNPTQVGSSEINADQIRFTQIGISQVNLTQASPTQVDSNQVDSYKVSLPSSIASEQFFSSQLGHTTIPQLLSTINSTALNLWNNLIQPATPFDINLEIKNLPQGQLTEAQVIVGWVEAQVNILATQ